MYTYALVAAPIALRVTPAALACYALVLLSSCSLMGSEAAAVAAWAVLAPIALRVTPGS